MTKYDNHHITYDPEWTVDLRKYQHRCITIIQNTKTTPEFYADLTNFVHAVCHEWQRVRMELDMEKQ